jgi:ketosteroid isomerase-like protein
MALSTADQMAVLDIVARADMAATRRDIDAYVAFFGEQAVLDGVMGTHRGRIELRSAVDPIWSAEGSSSVHLTMNAVVDSVADDPERAVATSILLILGTDPPISIHSLSAIRQVLERTNGTWLITRRTVSPMNPDIPR